MIRINLLPFRAAREKENVRRQISIYILTIVLFLVGMGYLYWEKSKELTGLKQEEKNLQIKLAEYNETIKKVNALTKRIQEITKKLEVIAQLEKKKSGPVHLLDEVAMAVPKDQLWLVSLDEAKGILTLKGTAKGNEVVATFMTNLEKSKYITSVDLQTTRLLTLPEYNNLKVSDFILNCKTYSFMEAPKEGAVKKGDQKKKR